MTDSGLLDRREFFSWTRHGLGSAAFLKLERSEGSQGHACCLGALFVVSARGEPLEFGYNRVRVPQPYLWRQADLRRYTERRLTSSLLSVCSQQPRILLCMATEISTELFSMDLQMEIPVARVGITLSDSRRVDTNTGEILDDEPRVHVAWQPAQPDETSLEHRLFEHLSSHGLLLEPFERAGLGLRETYGPQPCESRF